MIFFILIAIILWIIYVNHKNIARNFKSKVRFIIRITATVAIFRITVTVAIIRDPAAATIIRIMADVEG